MSPCLPLTLSPCLRKPGFVSIRGKETRSKGNLSLSPGLPVTLSSLGGLRQVQEGQDLGALSAFPSQVRDALGDDLGCRSSSGDVAALQPAHHMHAGPECRNGGRQ